MDDLELTLFGTPDINSDIIVIKYGHLCLHSHEEATAHLV